MNTRKMFTRLAGAAVYTLPTATVAGFAAFLENEKRKELVAAEKAGATVVDKFQSVPGVGGFWRKEVVKPPRLNDAVKKDMHSGMPFRTGF